MKRHALGVVWMVLAGAGCAATHESAGRQPADLDREAQGRPVQPVPPLTERPARGGDEAHDRDHRWNWTLSGHSVPIKTPTPDVPKHTGPYTFHITVPVCPDCGGALIVMCRDVDHVVKGYPSVVGVQAGSAKAMFDVDVDASPKDATVTVYVIGGPCPGPEGCAGYSIIGATTIAVQGS